MKSIFLAGVSRTVAQNSFVNVALCLRNTKCFIGRILQAEPKKLASVVKPKTRRALGIVVDFVGDHLTGVHNGENVKMY